MKKIQFGLIALLLGASVSTSAIAHDSIGFSLNIGAPYFYSPPAVYYAPPPVVYYEPRYIYRERYTPNVYYYPSSQYYYQQDRWQGRHGYDKHHKHWKHRD